MRAKLQPGGQRAGRVDPALNFSVHRIKKRREQLALKPRKRAEIPLSQRDKVRLIQLREVIAEFDL